MSSGAGFVDAWTMLLIPLPAISVPSNKKANEHDPVCEGHHHVWARSVNDSFNHAVCMPMDGYTAANCSRSQTVI